MCVECAFLDLKKLGLQHLVLIQVCWFSRCPGAWEISLSVTAWMCARGAQMRSLRNWKNRGLKLPDSCFTSRIWMVMGSSQLKTLLWWVSVRQRPMERRHGCLMKSRWSKVSSFKSMRRRSMRAWSLCVFRNSRITSSGPWTAWTQVTCRQRVYFDVSSVLNFKPLVLWCWHEQCWKASCATNNQHVEKGIVGIIILLETSQDRLKAFKDCVLCTSLEYYCMKTWTGRWCHAMSCNVTMSVKKQKGIYFYYTFHNIHVTPYYIVIFVLYLACRGAWNFEGPKYNPPRFWRG